MLASLLLALFLFLPGVARAADARLSEVDLRRRESYLLGRRVDLSGLLRWERITGQWLKPVDPLTAPLMVVHVWDVSCAPCIAELGELKKIIASLKVDTLIRFVLVSDTIDTPRLNEFLNNNARILPDVDQYQNSTGILHAILQDRTWPTTLLVDRDGVIRHAFLGSIKDRRAELLDSIDRHWAVLGGDQPPPAKTSAPSRKPSRKESP